MAMQQAGQWENGGWFGLAVPAGERREARPANAAAAPPVLGGQIPQESGKTVGANVGANASANASARGSDRVMNASQPEDADRNLDFDALVQKYEKKIFNVIYRFLGDYEDAVT